MYAKYRMGKRPASPETLLVGLILFFSSEASVEVTMPNLCFIPARAPSKPVAEFLFLFGVHPPLLEQSKFI